MGVRRPRSRSRQLISLAPQEPRHNYELQPVLPYTMPDTTFWAWVAGSFGLGWACNSFYQSRTVANGAAQQQGYRTGAAAASDASIGKKARAQSDAFPAIVDNKGPMKLVRNCPWLVLLCIALRA